MPDETNSRTASIERGEIDSGKTGEKVAGFDPATAPMETDAEAGGVATHPAAAYIGAKPVDHNATATGTAMRANDDQKGYRWFRGWVIAVAAAAVAVIAVVFFSR